jgi:hypothetical protein
MKKLYQNSILLCLSLTIFMLLAGAAVAQSSVIPVVKISTPNVPSVPSNDTALNLSGTNWELSNFQNKALIHVDYWAFDKTKNLVSGTGWSLPWQYISGNDDRIVLHPDQDPLVLVFVNPSSFIGYNAKGLYCIGTRI